MEFTKKAQNLKKGLNRFSHRIREQGRRICAVLLCASMVISGFPSSFFQAFASDGSEEFYYELDRESLYEAICMAVSEGTTVDRELDFTGEYAEQYAELFDADGTLYELKDLEVEKDRDRDKVLELRAFVRVEGDIPLDEYYEIDGEESVIFLLTNRSKDATSAVIYIDDLETEMIEIVSAASVSRDGGPGSKASAEEVSGGAGGESGASGDGAAEISAEGETEAAEDEAEAAEDAEIDSEISTDDQEEDASAEADAEAGQDANENEDSEDSADTSDKDSEAGGSDSSDDAGSDSSDSSADKGSSDDKDASDGRDNSEGRDHANRGDRSDRNDGSEKGDRSDRSDNDRSDRENSSNDRGFSGGRSRSDNGKASGRGSDSGSRSESDKDSGSDSSDKTVSISSNHVGLLSMAIVEELVIDQRSDSQRKEDEDPAPAADYVVDDSDINSNDITITPDDGSDDIVTTDEADDIVITIDEGSDGIVITTDSDVTITADSEVTIASASDADEDSSDSDTSTGDTIDGEIYDAVILDAKKAAVAFVTTAEDLGLDKFSHLEDQTIDAKIYEDDSYGFRLADGTSITLTGMMPVDAEVKAYPVEVEIEDVNILAAYDITIFDKHGKEFQPEEDDAIEVLIENDAIYEALDDEHELTIYHMEDEFDEPEEIAIIEPAPRRLQALSFLADRFSIYIVGDGTLTDINTGETVVDYTVEFHEHVFDAEEGFTDEMKLISTQNVLEEDYLNEPSVPEIEHHVFDGWFTEMQTEGDYEDGEYPGYKWDFSETVGTNIEAMGDEYIDEHNTIILYSDYDVIYYVYYMLEEGSAETFEDRVVFTDEYHDNNSTLDTTNAETIYQTSHLTSQQAVDSWYYYENDDHSGEKIYVQNGMKITENMILYPDITNAIWIYFTMGVGDDEDVEAVDPIYISSTAEKIGDLPGEDDVKRAGYTFAGWYTADVTDENGNIITPGVEVTSDSVPKELINDDGWIDLYAHWNPANVGYTVNIWRQKATDGQLGLDQKVVQSDEKYENYIKYYDYAESFTVSSADSTLITGTTPDISILNSYSGFGETVYQGDGAYNGFEYNQTRSENDIANKVMAADSSTIINVFYDRQTITWNFYSRSSSTTNSQYFYGSLIGLYGTNITPTNGSEAAGTWDTWTLYEDVGRFSTSYYNWVMSGDEGEVTTIFETEYVFKRSQVTNRNGVITTSATDVNFWYGDSVANRYIIYYLEVTNDSQVDENSTAASQASSAGVPYTRVINEGTENEVTYVFNRAIQMTSTSSSSKYYLNNKFVGYNLAQKCTVTRRTNNPDNATYGTLSDVTIGEYITLGNDYCIYCDAITYYIDLYSNHDGEQLIESIPVKYGADLSTIELPEDLDAEEYGPAYWYKFTGTWYEDPSFTAEFVIPATMPANNLAAYADWELKDVTVTFQSYIESDLYDILIELYGEDNITVVSEGGVDSDDPWAYSITIKASEMLKYSLDDGITAENSGRYDFAGWLNVDTNKVFNFMSNIYTNTVIQAFWLEEETVYHIQYNINHEDYEDVNPVLGHSHEHSSWAEVRELTDVFEEVEDIEELEESFLCWNTKEDGTGTNYYPDDDINFEKVDAVPVYDNDGNFLYYVYNLYAVWAEVKTATLTLDYNYPEGYENPAADDNPDDAEHDGHPQTTVTENNLASISLDETSELTTTVIVIGDEESGMKVYRFAGWSEDENAEAADVGAHETVAVNETETPNVLYAVWLEADEGKKVSEDSEAGVDGESISVGDVITYEISYENYYNEVSAVIIITDTLTDGLEYVEGSATPSDGLSISTDNDGSTTLTWMINVEPLGSGSVTFKAVVTDHALIEDEVSNQASIQVGEDEAVYTVPVTNEITSYGFDIFKYWVGSYDGLYLADAEFTLTAVDEESGESRTAYFEEYIENDKVIDYVFDGWDLTEDSGYTDTIITDSDGMAYIVGLPAGTYYLTETKAPDGFVALSEPIELTISEDGEITIDSNDEEHVYFDEDYNTICILDDIGGFEVTIYKYDPNRTAPQYMSYDIETYEVTDYSLEGAEFVLSRYATDEYGDPTSEIEYAIATQVDADYDGYNYSYMITEWTSDSSKATALVTNNNGFVNIINIEEGTYTLTEIKAPEGYRLLEETIGFTVNSDGSVTSVSGPADLEEGFICVANYEITGDFELDKTDANGNPLEGAKFVLGAYAEIDGGSYLNSDVETLTVTDDGKYEYFYFTFTGSNGTYVLNRNADWVNSIEDATELETDAEGKITIEGLWTTEWLNGIYFLIETEAPEGYKLLEDPICFTVSDDGTIVLATYDESHVSIEDSIITVVDDVDGYPVDVYKYDSVTKEPLATAEFVLARITEEDSYEYAVFNYDYVTGTYSFDSWRNNYWYNPCYIESDKEGYIYMTGLEPGDYILIELYPSSWTYLLPEDCEFAFTVNEDGTVTSEYWDDEKAAISISNDEQRLEVEKTDENGNPLEGAEFVLGTVYQHHQEMSTNYYEVPVDETGWYYEYLIFDTDSETGEYVLKEDYYSDTRENATKLVTGSDGMIHVRGLYTTGLYFVVETTAPAGYSLLEDPIVFYVDYDGSITIYLPTDDDHVDVDGTTITVTDDPATYEVWFYKYGNDGNGSSGNDGGSLEMVSAGNEGQLRFYDEGDINWNNELDGAAFILSRTDENGDPEYAIVTYVENYYYLITSWTSDINSASTLVSGTNDPGWFRIDNMEAGIYTLTETAAPTGYQQLIEDIVFEVSANDGVSYVTIISGPGEENNTNMGGAVCIANDMIFGDFDLQKTDENGNSLSGAEFILGWFGEMQYSIANNPVQPYLSTEDGKYYYYYAILNYDETTEAYVLDLYDGAETLDGATTIVVGDDGTIKITNLPSTSLYDIGYFLIETKAPDGYNLLTDPIVFTVEDDGTIKIIVDSKSATMDEGGTVMTVINEAGYELPSTGGSGTLPFRALGAFLSGSALWLLFLTLRRRRRWVES